VAKWRGLDIDEMEALIKGEDEEGLLMQARGWECLYEVYDDQVVLLTDQKAELDRSGLPKPVRRTWTRRRS